MVTDEFIEEDFTSVIKLPGSRLKVRIRQMVAIAQRPCHISEHASGTYFLCCKGCDPGVSRNGDFFSRSFPDFIRFLEKDHQSFSPASQ